MLGFPVVGGLIGAGVGAAWWAAGRAWPVGVAAAVAVVVDLGLTGLLHFDGLCDSADGLLAHLERQRRLEVMAGPEIGAFAVAVAGVTLLLRWTALASIRPSTAPSIRLIALIAALWMASRTWMAVAVVVVPYARSKGGLATAFLGLVGDPLGVVSLVAGGAGALVLAAGWKLVAGPVAVVAGVGAGGRSWSCWLVSASWAASPATYWAPRAWSRRRWG